MNNNGLVSFGAPETQYTSDPFPLPDGRALVAPFWADVDVRVAGRVLYRQSRAPGILARATADVGAAFPHLPFTAAWVFVATWDRVAFYGATVAKVQGLNAGCSPDLGGEGGWEPGHMGALQIWEGRRVE